jgi:hypothetical protein
MRRFLKESGPGGKPNWTRARPFRQRFGFDRQYRAHNSVQQSGYKAVVLLKRKDIGVPTLRLVGAAVETLKRSSRRCVLREREHWNDDKQRE